MRALLPLLLLPVALLAQPADDPIEAAARLLDKDVVESKRLLSQALEQAEKSGAPAFMIAAYRMDSVRIPDAMLMELGVHKKIRHYLSDQWNGTTVTDARATYLAAAMGLFGDQNSRDSSIWLYNRALEILGRHSMDRSLIAERCYQGLGDIYKYFLYRANEAEQMYSKSLEILETTPHSDPYRLIRVYYNLAATNRTQADYQKALSYGMACIQKCKETDQTVWLEQVYTIVANIYRDIGSTEEAKEYYNQAISLNARSRGSPSLLAWYYQALGQTYSYEGDYAQAITKFEVADQLFTQAYNLSSLNRGGKPVWIYGLVQQSDAAIKRGETSLALACLRKAEQLAKEFGESSSMNEVRLGFAEYYRKLNRPEMAMKYYHECLRGFDTSLPKDSILSVPVIRPEQSTSITFLALFGKAGCLMEAYENNHKMTFLMAAIRNLELAENVFMTAQSAVEGEEAKWRRMQDSYDVYERLMKCAFEWNRREPSPKAANAFFSYSERSKASGLRRSVALAKRTNTSIGVDTLLQSLNEVKRRWFSLAKELTTEYARESPDSTRIQLIHDRQVQLDRRLGRLEQQMRVELPGYARLMEKGEVPTIQAVQNNLMADQQIIEYFMSEDVSYGIAIGKSDYQIERLTGAAKADTLINALMSHFRDGHSSLDPVAHARFVSSAHNLYLEFVAPFKSRMAAGDQIRFIPDGRLRLVPFEVLISEAPPTTGVSYKNLEYLVSQFEIGYAPSCTLLQESKGHLSGASILAMGYSGKGVVSEAGIPLGEIRGSLQEINQLRARFEGMFFTDDDASEKKFKELAQDAGLIHLSIHGEGNTGDGFDSRIYFNSGGDSLEDGRLYAFELFGMSLKARLTLLTTCESGYGKLYKGEGLMGLASAFAYAGCQNTIMSLWKVNDQSSATLVNQFYNNLEQGADISSALTSSKRYYLDQADEYTSDPRFWATLVLYGNFDQEINLATTKASSMIIVAAGLLLLLAGAGYYLFRKSTAA